MFIDQCVHHPLLYFPVFYSIKGVMGKPTDQPADEAIKESLGKYRGNFSEDMVALWKVPPPPPCPR